MARVVDLSHRVSAGIQVYPGDPQVTFTPAATVGSDGYAVTSLTLGSHTGTHVDAPSHLFARADRISDLEPSRFVGPALLVDAGTCTPGECIDELSLDRLGGRVIVVVRTGWSRHFGSPTYFENPYFAPSLADQLLACGVRSVAVDLPSPDPVGACDAALPFHRTFLGAGGIIYENLTNLAALENGDFVFSGLPLKLDSCDGSPVRAVAVYG